MMDQNDIDAFARGMVPYVRQCMAEATAVPPDLAEQVANAIRLLNESPATQRNDVPQSPPLLILEKSPRVTRIERDNEGNFVPVYDGSQS